MKFKDEGLAINSEVFSAFNDSQLVSSDVFNSPKSDSSYNFPKDLTDD